jgi:hypothetical protein
MKIRNGFISNSSSSSFTCDVCKENFSGWDASPSEFDHQNCIRGHVFCSDKIVNKDKFDEAVDRFEEKYGGNYDKLPKDWYEDENRIEKYGLSEEDQYEVPEEFCPICSMNIICDIDCVTYIYKKYNTNNKELAAEIRSKFNTYKEFIDYITKSQVVYLKRKKL